MTNVTPDDLLAGLRAIGVSPGDVLVVHSSLSSFGRVEGGAGAVARALVESVSPGGTLFVPTFTYAKLPFDPATTPSLAGAISEAVRLLPGAVRSRQPTHPWAGVGPAAEAVLAGHELTTPFGPNSPAWRLWERDAKVLLIGVDQRANSMIHVAEELLRVPYLDRTRVAQVVRAGGATEAVTVRRPGCSAGFGKVEGAIRAAGGLRHVRVGSARLTLTRARDVVSAATGMLNSDPTSLLCDVPACERCAEARVIIAKAGLSRD